MNKTPLATAISSVLAAGAVTAPHVVLAQSDTTDEPKAKDQIEEVVVTGSRIKKDAFTTSAPMDIVDVKTASVQGIANIGQLLQTTTIAAGSPQVTSATSFQFVENGGLGTSTISLRGLGANRTLVLLNGRRAGPAGVQGGTSSFDLNVLPLSTIERVEILKDGASSIYGSDAVAGVVNIITRKDEGVTIDGFVSAPSEKGGEESRFSASFGKVFDRGNFRVTADYDKQSHLRRGQRDYFTCGNQYIFDQNTGKRADIVDPRTGKRWCEDLTWGHVWLYDYAADTNVPSPYGGSLLSQYDYDGNLGQYIPGYAVDPSNPSYLTQPGGFYPVAYDPTSDAVTNDNHPFQDRESLNPQVQLITLYGEGEYQFNDRVTGYTEVLFNRRTTKSDGYQQYWSYIYSGDYNFGPDPSDPNCADPNDPLFDECTYALIQDQGNSLSAAAGWFGQQWYSPTAITDHNDQSVEVDYYRVVGGLRGPINDSWDWDLSFNYSRSDGKYTNDRIYNDSIRDQNWLTGSCVGTVTSVRGVPCIDIPWLDPELLRGNISQELRDFMFGTETGETTYTQWSIDGYATGDTFDLPAGPVGLAAGFQYRYDKMNDTPGEITYNPITGESNAWLDDAAGITTGDDTTWAVFAEVDVPILADKPAFRNLTLNASARYTNVDSYGSDTTWKVGLNWQLTDSIRLRGNRATSFRAPALYELYIANQTSYISQRSDPCIRYDEAYLAGDISQTVHDNCAADPAGLPPGTPPNYTDAYTGGTITPTVFTGGGAGLLEAETADSTTYGIIWQPSFANLSVSIDYFNFQVKGEVDRLGGSQIILGCYESHFGYASGGTEPLCDLFDRTNINKGIDNVMDSYINIANQENSGIDYAVRYIASVGPGDLTIDLRATQQKKDVRALFEETSEDLNGRVGDPEWVGQSAITYDSNKWSFFWGVDWIGPSSSEQHFGRDYVTYYTVNYDAVLYTDDVFYHSFSAQYRMDNGITLLAGIANAFDQHPPQLTRVQTTDEYTMVGNSLLASNYDMIGRRFFVNATWAFE